MSQLIVAATEFELSSLSRELGCQKEKPLLGFACYRSTYRRKKLFLLKSGPGLANAAAATALAIERYRPSHVFNVGVCGAYSQDLDLLTAVVGGVSAVFADTGVDIGDQFLSMQAIDLPLARLKGGEIFNSISLSYKNLPKRIRRGVFFTVAASSGSFQQAAEVKNRFRTNTRNLVCEDMESAAVGLMALKASVPCTVLRAVSNLCGDRNYRAWRLSDAAEAAQKELLKCL